MNDKLFIVLQGVINDLLGLWEVAFTNAAFIYLVHPYTYEVHQVDVGNAERRSLGDRSASYLHSIGDGRADKYSVVEILQEYIRHSESLSRSWTVGMNTAHLKDALWCADQGKVYHWNGAQLYTVQFGRVIVYDLLEWEVVFMSLAKSRVYAEGKAPFSVDVKSVQEAAWARVINS